MNQQQTAAMKSVLTGASTTIKMVCILIGYSVAGGFYGKYSSILLGEWIVASLIAVIFGIFCGIELINHLDKSFKARRG